MTIINAGFATLSEEDMEGLGFLQGGIARTFRNTFDRFRYQLYHYVVIENGGLDERDMRDKLILETGCGRGGGLNYLAQVLRPHEAIGMDMSRSNIEYCKSHWPKNTHTPLQFIHGDAEHLSTYVPRLSMDMVIDIEAFFYYQDKRAFLREVHSILKEDGRLYLAFFIQRTRLEEIHNFIRLYFEIIKEDDITDNVTHSLRLDNQRLTRFADQNFGFSKQTNY